MMRARCCNPNFVKFSSYGGRGITVCDRWQKFDEFLADMGPRPAGTSIDRINNDGNYEPGNCRWATASEQASNQRPRRPHKRVSGYRLNLSAEQRAARGARLREMNASGRMKRRLVLPVQS